MIRTISDEGIALAHEKLVELVDYDPATGVFRWRKNGRGYVAGQTVGSPNGSGYIEMRVGGCRGLAHRFAWFYVHGGWPKMVDHVDGDGCNNAISNLRLATYSEQNANLRRRKDNRSGVKGVCWDSSIRRWKARVYFQGRKWQQTFKSKEEAATAVRKARVAMHGEFARHE